MKKCILPLIIYFMIILMTNISNAATGTVNVMAVRIRESMSTDSNIVTNIYENDEVEILEENGEWYKVKYGDKVGYAKSEFFKTTGEIAKTETTNQNTNDPVTPQTNNTVVNEPVQNSVVQEPVSTNTTNNQNINVGEVVVLTNSIKLRIIPNITANEKIEFVQGTSVTILTEFGNWYKVTDQKETGWIAKAKFVSIQNTQATVEQPKVEENVETPSQPVENVVAEEEEKPEVAVPEQTTTNTIKQAIVIVETARVRKSASQNADIVDTLDEDDIVNIEGEEGDFYKISSDKVSGYISKSLVKEKDVTSRSITRRKR